MADLFERQTALQRSYTPNVAIVTGGVQGLGYAIVQRLAESGIDLAINDIPAKKDRIDAVVAEIRALGRRAIAVPGDVSNEEDVQQIVEKTAKELGSVDIFVANAGIARFAPFLESTTKDFDDQIRINLRSMYLCYKYAAKQMIKQGRGGRIIGASSACGVEASPNLDGYNSSKFAVRGLTQTAALELRKYGITVNCYAPGLIFTALTENDQLKGQSMDVQTAERKKVVNFHPETPTGLPEVIASMVNYIAQPESYFVTAQTLRVDGGVRPC